MTETRAPYFMTRMKPDPARAAAWEALAGYIQPDIPEGARLLELGAGECLFVNRVQAARKAAVDLSPDLASFAAPEVETRVGAAWSLAAFGPRAFDVVFASNLFEHLTWEELDRTLEAVKGVLAPGGRLIHLHPNIKYCAADYWDDYTHRIPLTHLSVGDLLATRGFAVERVVPRLVPFSAREAAFPFPVKPWMIRLYLASPWRPRAAQMYMVARKA